MSTATAVRALRVMFPHDRLPDEAYEQVVAAIEKDAKGDDAVRATFHDGLERLAGEGFTDLDDDAAYAVLQRRHEEGDAFFELLRSTAVVALYDQPLVWKAFGYEGASVHLGGYLHRGFDDLDWLPDPPLALDPSAGSHHN